MPSRRSAVAPATFVLLVGIVVSCAEVSMAQSSVPDRELKVRLERALDDWARWLSGYLYQVPGTDLYTLNPTLGTGNNPYRDIAGNQFAAAAAAYWLDRAKPDEETARPLRGLIKLTLGTHVAVKTIDRPDIQKWGAGYSGADNWHADLFAGTSGMLMLDGLPPREREQLLRILAWEADKQVEYGISKESRTLPGRSPQHSVGESNAWSTALLQTARSALPGAANQEAWRETAILYSLNSICMPGDMTSDRIVAGRPLKDRVKGANFEPGGIQEHHGFYHPGYMGWPLAYQAYAAILDETLPEPQRNPDVYLNNWKYVFDRLKQGAFAEGRFVYCAGIDWNSYGYGNAHILPVAIFAAARFGDADAALMADRWLSLMEHEQSLSGGAVQGARLATMQRLRMNDFAWYEAISGCSLAHSLWVMDRMDTSAMPQPATEEEYHSRNGGTYHEPNAKLVWHRDRHRWASICWRSAFGQWQVVVQPVELPHLLKFNQNGVGQIEATGARPQKKYQFFEIGTFEEGGFWSLGTCDRLSKRAIHGNVFPLARQHLALVALPEGPTIFVDQCEAVDQLWLLRDGGLGLRLAADVFNENRVNLAAGSDEHSFTQHPHSDTWHDLGSRSVTIEKRLTIHAIAGEGSFQLLQKRRRPGTRDELLYPSDSVGVGESLLAHELYFGPPAYERPKVVPPGDWFRRQVLVFYCDPEQTPAEPSGSITGEYPCLAVSLPRIKRTVVINFSESERSVESPSGRITVGPRSVRVASGDP